MQRECRGQLPKGSTASDVLQVTSHLDGCCDLQQLLHLLTICHWS